MTKRFGATIVMRILLLVTISSVFLVPLASVQAQTGPTSNPYSPPIWPLVENGVDYGASSSYDFFGKHTGRDFRGTNGDPLYAVCPGEVIYYGDWPWEGEGSLMNTLWLDCGNGDYRGYGHTSHKLDHKEVGDIVEQGEVIAYVGLISESGYGSGDHLHFTKTIEGVDPRTITRENFTWVFEEPMTLIDVNADPRVGTQVGSEYIIPALDYGEGCEFNIKHGLEMYAPGGARTFNPGERVYYNLQLGSLDSDSGFQDLYNPNNGLDTPGGCLCDLATHMYHAADMAGILAGYDEAGHDDSGLGDIIGNPPKPWIIIWHESDYDPNNPDSKHPAEKDFWIENQHGFAAIFHWEELSNGEIKIWWEKASIEIAKEESIATIADFPFVVDVRDSHATAANLVGVADLQNPPIGIIWHQTATGPIDSAGIVIDGLRLCQLEKNRGDSRCGYHVVVGVDEITVDGEVFAVAQWLIDTDSQAWHAREYNAAYLAISYVDQVKNSPPTPAQLKTMLEISNAWAVQFGIDPDEIKGHKEVHSSTRGDPVGVDMSEMREKVDAVVERTSSTGGTYYFSMPSSQNAGGSSASNVITTEPAKTPFKLINWTPQWNRSKMLMWYIYMSAPVVLLLLLVFTENNLKKLVGKKSKAAKFDRRLNTLNLIGLAVVSLGFIVMVAIYQPVSYRPQVTYLVVDGNDKQPEEISVEESDPDEEETPSQLSEENGKESSAAGVWTAIAAEAEYKNPALLEQFCTKYSYPRGPDGRYLPIEQGGKIFPCELAAAIAKGETDTTVWSNADPRQPGVWGHNLGWVNAPDYFSMTLEEIADGRSMSRMAEACRKGLEVVANNAVVQAKYPGLTAQTMYTSMGCSIGRGQTLAVHFLPGGILGDLENMDVWDSDGPAIEAVYRHLVSRVSSVCGEQSWYYSGNTEVSLCSYNPNSWGVPEHAWYWDVIRAQSISLRSAIQNHSAELAAVGDAPQVRIYEEAKVTEEEKNSEATYSVPMHTTGSGVYAIWDTIPSLTYRTVRGWSDNSFTDFVEQSLLTVAEIFYSDETLMNLGFVVEWQTEGGDH